MGFNIIMGFGMGNNNNYQLEEQIFNLSIQLLNTGIQAFKIEKKYIGNLNFDKYFNQIKIIQINFLISELEQKIKMMPQQRMMQQQIMEQIKKPVEESLTHKNFLILKNKWKNNTYYSVLWDKY